MARNRMQVSADKVYVEIDRELFRRFCTMVAADEKTWGAFPYTPDTFENFNLSHSNERWDVNEPTQIVRDLLTVLGLRARHGCG
jgi:hypothetical protein